MKHAVDEWISKAEDDFDDARRILRARNRVDFSNACFDAQQAAEKYMKAVLVLHGRAVNRTHDLARLLDQITEINGFWDALRDATILLTDYAVRSRYPEGGAIDKSTAKLALRACASIREHLRVHLLLSGRSPGPKPTPRKRPRRT